ncbi:MAG: hypothetical protein V4726_02920 [Verrucomicrobiota bacterium]
MSPFPLLRFPRPARALMLVASLTLAALSTSARAVVDDSHSAAMEAAVPAVKLGFKIRQEYWKGTMKSGEQKAVRQQLFKGNEYWFFLGTDADGATLKVDVYDSKGTKINVETKTSENSAAVRVVAPATGSCTVVFTITTKDKEEIPWALAYGYR